MHRCLIIATILTALAVPALAEDFDYQPLQPLQPIQPIQPLLPTYQLQLPPVSGNYNYRIPAPQIDPWGVTTPKAPQPQRHVDPQDYMRQFTTPEQIERQFKRMDRADQRRIWGRCAKYNIHCVNMLRSLGGNRGD